MSDTPRTDAAAKPSVFSIDHLRYVEADFARQFERELNAASQAYDCAMSIHGTVMQERDELKAQLTSALELTSINTEAGLLLAYAQRDELRALAKELAEALTDIKEHSQPPFVDGKWINYAHDVSKQALTKARAAGLIE